MFFKYAKGEQCDHLRENLRTKYTSIETKSECGKGILRFLNPE